MMDPGSECSHEPYWRAEIAAREEEIARLRGILHRRTAPHGGGPGVDVDLTEREQQVLRLIAQGRSTQEIAQALILSVNSIKTHTRSLFRKLGVSTRTQAALWAVDCDREIDLTERPPHRLTSSDRPAACRRG